MKNTIIVFLLIFSTKLFAQTEKFYQINGVERKAIFFEPKINSEKFPVVFVFHGHGGNAKHASRNVNFHQEIKAFKMKHPCYFFVKLYLE